MKTILWSNVLILAVAFTLGLGLTLIAAQKADAHNIGWRWEWPSVSAKIEAREMPYGIQVMNGCLDYDSNTDLGAAITQCSVNTFTGNLIHVDGFWDTAWDALAEPYSHGVACINFPNPNSNGYCNETNHQVDFGYVYWNTKGGPYSSSEAEYIARHEDGHVFGLAHPPCSDPLSVMRYLCATLPTFLTSHDISDINAKY